MGNCANPLLNKKVFAQLCIVHSVAYDMAAPQCRIKNVKIMRAVSNPCSLAKLITDPDLYQTALLVKIYFDCLQNMLNNNTLKLHAKNI